MTAPASVDAPTTAAASVPGATARRRALVLAGAVALVLAVTVLSLAVGSRQLAPADVLRSLVEPDGSETSVIVRELRLPRTAVGLVVGAALGLAGAQMQGLTRNPLADPGLLGVSAGAALAVVVGIALGIGSGLGQVACAFAGALAAAVAVWVLAATGRGGASPLPLVLAGVALTALLSSLTTVIVLLDADTLDQFRFWVVGSIAGRDAGLLLTVLPVVAVALVLTVASARSLDLMALGDELAVGLGARLARGRLAVALAATLLTAASVAVAGPLVFVGLVVPHLARALVGPAHAWLLPVSGLLGAVLLVASDVVGRVVVRPGELQVGIVTALVGAPFLVALVQRRRVVSS